MPSWAGWRSAWPTVFSSGELHRRPAVAVTGGQSCCQQHESSDQLLLVCHRQRLQKHCFCKVCMTGQVSSLKISSKERDRLVCFDMCAVAAPACWQHLPAVEDLCLDDHGPRLLIDVPSASLRPVAGPAWADVTDFDALFQRTVPVCTATVFQLLNGYWPLVSYFGCGVVWWDAAS
jgi:hypothetical protein